MIHEGICTYEVCKLAKDKGFPQHIGNDAYIVDNEYDDKCEVGCHYPIQFIPDYLPTIVAPTQSLLQRWLREEEGIHISVEYEWVEGVDDWTFWAYIKKINNAKVVNDAIKSGFNTYELALEDALKYALENLV
jgi:hypothetical protein